jgi:hypothetical protein
MVLPRWMRMLIALATVVVIGAVALLIGRPETGPVVPVSAIIAGLLAFAFVAWRAQHPR